MAEPLVFVTDADPTADAAVCQIYESSNIRKFFYTQISGYLQLKIFGYLHPLQRSPQYTNLRRFLINTKSSKICILRRPLKGVQIPEEYVDLHSLDICVCATF